MDEGTFQGGRSQVLQHFEGGCSKKKKWGGGGGGLTDLEFFLWGGGYIKRGEVNISGWS